LHENQAWTNPCSAGPRPRRALQQKQRHQMA
jgi:hypothetical protein